jgi:hypothetical protein
LPKLRFLRLTKITVTRRNSLQSAAVTHQSTCISLPCSRPVNTTNHTRANHFGLHLIEPKHRGSSSHAGNQQCTKVSHQIKAVGTFSLSLSLSLARSHCCCCVNLPTPVQQSDQVAMLDFLVAPRQYRQLCVSNTGVWFDQYNNARQSRQESSYAPGCQVITTIEFVVNKVALDQCPGLW